MMRSSLRSDTPPPFTREFVANRMSSRVEYNRHDKNTLDMSTMSGFGSCRKNVGNRLVFLFVSRWLREFIEAARGMQRGQIFADVAIMCDTICRRLVFAEIWILATLRARGALRVGQGQGRALHSCWRRVKLRFFDCGEGEGEGGAFFGWARAEID